MMGVGHSATSAAAPSPCRHSRPSGLPAKLSNAASPTQPRDMLPLRSETMRCLLLAPLLGIGSEMW